MCLPKPKTESRLLDRKLLSRPILLDGNLCQRLSRPSPLHGLLRLRIPLLFTIARQLRKLRFRLARVRAFGDALLLVFGARGTATASFLWLWLWL